jgi:hypothetical protein
MLYFVDDFWNNLHGTVMDKCDADDINCLLQLSFSFSDKCSTLPTSMLCSDNANILYNDGRYLRSTRSKIVSGVALSDDDGLVILEKSSFPG